MTATDDPSVAEAVLPNLVSGDVVVLHESAVLPGDVVAGVDVVRLAPWASGYVVRDEFAQGRGVPLFASVVVDGSGGAWEIALAYARAIGATRAGVIRTTDEEYATARSQAEVALMRGAVLPMVRAGFDSLVRAGCQPEVAYLRCVYGLRLFAEELVRGVFDADLAAARTRDSEAVGPDALPDAMSDPLSDPLPDPLPGAAALVRSMMAWERAEDPRLH